MYRLLLCIHTQAKPNRVVAWICANLYHFPNTADSNDDDAPKHSSPSRPKATLSEPIPDSFELKRRRQSLGGHSQQYTATNGWIPNSMFASFKGNHWPTCSKSPSSQCHWHCHSRLVSDFDFCDTGESRTTCPTLCIKGDPALEFLFGCHLVTRGRNHSRRRVNLFANNGSMPQVR